MALVTNLLVLNGDVTVAIHTKRIVARIIGGRDDATAFIEWAATCWNNGIADSRFAPSQWETSLQSNAVSHWLGTNLESALNENVIRMGHQSH